MVYKVYVCFFCKKVVDDHLFEKNFVLLQSLYFVFNIISLLTVLILFAGMITAVRVRSTVR